MEENNTMRDDDIKTQDHSKVLEHRTVEYVMEDSFLRYSMSVIVDRALPDVRDGLKPVHRRILYVMNKLGLTPTAKTEKSAKIVGDVMGKYHPHGDTAIYEAMVRLAQGWVMRYPLVQGQGNFGSMDGDPPAAYRYTEAKLGRAGYELLTDLEKETVDFRDNYDGSVQEPSVLPAKLPNLILNGQVGIAVGMATSIPTHNLNEVVDAIFALLDNSEATTSDLLKYVKGPDFPTGGTIYAGENMRQAYSTGKGSVVMRAETNIEETKNGRFRIVVTEIPYAVNKANLVLKIADLAKEKIPAISGLRDESSRGKVRIVIDLKKDSFPKKVLNQLFKLSPLQSTFHYNMLALVDGIQPRLLGLKDILREFISHRKNVVRRRTEFELKKAKDRAHILEGLTIALDHIDEVIKLIRASSDYDEALTGLMSKFNLTELQGRAILAMQLRKLTGLDRQEIENELAELRKTIAELEKILADEQEIINIIKKELTELKQKLGDERKTRIINHDLGKFSDEELIPEEDSVILLTNENYIKRTLVSDYRKQHRGGKGKRGMTTKEEDVIEQLIPAGSHDILYFFTNKGRVFRLKAYEVPMASLVAKGVAAVNLLQLQPEEKITSIIGQKKEDSGEDGYLFMATKKGTVKKTPLKDYSNIRTNGLIAIKLDDDDELCWIQKTSGNDSILISTSAGQAIRFDEKDVRSMGRTARGVRGVRLRPKDIVVGMDIARDDAKLMVISQNGYGKLTKISNFPSHKRGGVGIKAAVVNDKTGPIISVKTILDDSSELIMISSKGQTIRIGINTISVMGRTTQGVKIMSLSGEDTVASIGLIEEKDSPEESSTDKK